MDQLREYRTDTAEPPELDLWWQLGLAQARAAARPPSPRRARPPALTSYGADIYAPVEVRHGVLRGARRPHQGLVQRGFTLAPEAPYTELPEFLARNVDLIPAALDTLRYVDCALLARRITARCLLSVARWTRSGRRPLAL